MADKITVLIADDVEALRRMMRRMLERDGRFEVVGEVGDGAAAVELATGLQPDLVLLDMMMPILSGVEAIKEIRKTSPDSRILVFSGLNDVKGGSWGADGYLAKGASPSEVIASIESVMAPAG